MTFPNLPGHRHANTRANLQRACEELRYYAGKVWETELTPEKTKTVFRAYDLCDEIEIATPETANELFKQAHWLCAEMEEILEKCSK